MRPHYFFQKLLSIMLFACASSLSAGLERWQTVELGGEKIGYRQLAREVVEERVLTREELVITLQQPGEASRTSTITLEFEETRDGQPLSLSKKVSSQSANQTIEARVEGAELRVERSDGRQVDVSRHVLPDDFLMPYGIQLALRNAAGDARELQFSAFNFSKLAFETVRLKGQRQSGELAWHFTYQQGRTAQPSHWFTNEGFEVLREESVTGGETLVLYDCDKACALAPFSPTTHVYRQLIRAPVRMPEAALRGRVRYQLSGDSALVPPETAEQAVVSRNGGWQVDICTDCGAEDAPEATVLEAARQSTYWIAADDPEIQRLASEFGAEEEPLDVMARLTRFVSLHMNAQPDYAGFATASEALASGQGDCTEHALLLAALARAAGLPARIAIGLAYNTERFLGRKYVFVPHAWVQVWDGSAWRSFDSGLGEFHAGYIALALSYSGEVAHFTRVNARLHALQIQSAARVQTQGGKP